jgi:hypothetical protein
MTGRAMDGPAAARKLFGSLVSRGVVAGAPDEVASVLIANDLARRNADGALVLTDAGRARASRERKMLPEGVDAFRAQHMTLAMHTFGAGDDVVEALVDEGESPLAWLARRKGRDGRPLIDPHQFAAGERLRSDFTLAQLTPRVTSNWSSPGARGRGGNVQGDFTDRVIAARQRLRRAIDEAGPEFSGLLMDVCCFLHGLEDAERTRGWPARSAKIVLQLGLDRLARHYGFSPSIRGADKATIRRWTAEESAVPADEP